VIKIPMVTFDSGTTSPGNDRAARLSAFATNQEANMESTINHCWSSRARGLRAAAVPLAAALIGGQFACSPVDEDVVADTQSSSAPAALGGNSPIMRTTNNPAAAPTATPHLDYNG